MPIPLNHKLKRITKEIRLKNNLFGNDSEWMTWWYSGIYKNRSAESQPNVLVAFRELASGVLSDDVIHRLVPLTALGQVRVGTVWKDSICLSEVVYEKAKFCVDFTKGKWRVNSFYEATKQDDSLPFPQDNHPLKYAMDKNWIIEFPFSEGGKLLIPCLEFFSRCYGRSEEMKRILATYPWHGEKESQKSRLYSPLDEPEEPEKWKVKLRKRLVNGDVVLLAHAKYDPYTEHMAKSIYAQIESEHDPKNKNPAFIKVGPWFQGPALIKVKGIWFDNGKSFLALQVVGCSDPGGVPIFRDRENTNKTGPVGEDADIGSAWAGAPENTLVKPPEIVDLTGDDEPDHGAPTVEIQDPDFEVLGQARVIIDVRRDHAKSTAGAKSNGADASKFSSGEPYGGGKGVGHASIHARPIMESKGALRDMWDAMLFLQKKKPELIKSVEWFTFEDGFNKDAEPKLIGLQPFDENDEIDVEVRNWLYFDTTNKIPRGVLVARMMVGGKPVHIVEIQRRPRKKKDDDGKVKNAEESFKGMAFVLDDLHQFDTWMRRLQSDIRHVKGIVKNLVGACPGNAATFKHSPASEGQVPCEAAVLNAIGKIKEIKK